MSINGVGEKFNLDKLLEAQAVTKNVVKNVSEKVFEGMSETDGINLINEEFKKMGEIKFWHPHKFRIGKNTTKAFKEDSDSSVRLEINGHYFIDIGPVLFDHEGDYGDTFIFGENPKYLKLKNTAIELFQLGKKEFLEKMLSGKLLYDFLNNEAQKRNVILNLKTLGHRVGDFPHHLFYRGKLQEIEDIVLPNLWVLEIQISDQAGEYGAFFEDIL